MNAWKTKEKAIRARALAAAAVAAVACALPAEATMKSNEQARARFAELEKLGWNEVFHDPGTGDWKERWQLDGEKATVENTPDGMVFSAGPTEWDDASHAVLWTKASFAGDLRIEYDFTRMDALNKWVNILYIQATGIGYEPYDTDIASWAALRKTPAMKTYFMNMNLLHISYCAYGKEETTFDDDYVRARRYPVPPGGTLGADTGMLPDYFRTGLFRTGATLRVTVIKKGHDLLMRCAQGEHSNVFRWDTSGYPPVIEGRIGLRHMWMRSSRYRDVRVSVLRPEGDAP